jgi:salicylate 5-hydroxylase small subunit
LIDLALRAEVEDLYARYVACLDDGPLEGWPEFFVEDGRYTLIPRENHDRGLPLATMALESRGMLKDRVYGVLNTLFFAPYYQRHILGPLRIEADGEGVLVQTNYLVLRTKRNEHAEVYSCGRYVDRLARTAEGLRFTDKLCIFDSETIPNSVVYPV